MCVLCWWVTQTAATSSQYENIQPRQKQLAHIEQRINSNIWVIIPSDPVTSWHHCSSELIHILFFSGESGPKLSTTWHHHHQYANFCQAQSFLTHSPIGNNLEKNKVDHTGYVWSNQTPTVYFITTDDWEQISKASHSWCRPLTNTQDDGIFTRGSYLICISQISYSTRSTEDKHS